MGMFDRSAKRLLAEGIEATAVVLESRRAEDYEGVSAGEPWPWELGLNIIGTRRYWFRLEVRAPGSEPYEVHGEFKVPRKAENVNLFNAANHLGPGLELPVRVDPADSVSLEVDWDRFLASPGRKKAVRAADDAVRRQAVRDQLEGKPELAAKMQANNRIAVQAWAGAVRAGQMSREDFERTVTGEVESGRMDPADAEAARRSLDEAAGEQPPVADAGEAARIRAEGRKSSATVLERANTGREHRGGPVHRLKLDLEGREIVHHEVLNDRWAALLEPGMQTTVYIDPADPDRIALG